MNQFYHHVARRQFLQASIAASAASLVSQRCEAAETMFAQHLEADVVSSANLAIPTAKRTPFGWRTTTIADNSQPPLVLTWTAMPAEAKPTHFRLTIGLDERDEKVLELRLAQSGRLIGTLDLRFVTQFQVHQLALTPADVTEIRREGVSLQLTNGSDLEIFTAGGGIPKVLLPHLLVPGTASPMNEYFARLNSLACVQQFGWMEGCVLDGLLDLAELREHSKLKEVAIQHLSLFFKDNRLIYENNLSTPSDGKIYGIEGGLPFAALTRLDANSPLLDLALEFWNSRRRSTGSIQDGEHLSSEGAYTIAYPMALIAQARNSDELMHAALYQCRIRQARFFDGKEFWRTYNDDGKRGNRNWARGIAWQILGLTRTLTVAKDRDDVADLIIHLQRLADWIIKLQRDDGLWSVFADDPKLTPDTAGSAGIAAALAIGTKHGWLEANATKVAQKTLAGLQTHLTSDGFLGGVSQSNKGGEALQRSDYRTIYQMGMGLMAQLVAALHQP